MTTIQLIACVGMIAGLFMVLGISPAEMSDSIFSRLTAAPGSIRADINETTKRKKAGFFRREITEAQAVLAASGREGKFPMVCMASLVLFALGACTAILAGNAFLVPVLAVGFMLLPFWYVKLTAGGFKKDVAAELETALSVITTAYLRTENFQQAVEENVRYLHHPVQEVFQRFLTRIKHIDPEKHKDLTGRDNANILDCLRYMSEIGEPMWIRHVLVPEITDVDEYLYRTRGFIAQLKTVERVEVLPYHTLGVFKWDELGIPYTLKDVDPPAPERVEHATKILRGEFQQA